MNLARPAKMLTNGLLSLSQYHPVIIEGMGSYDPRDPALVASQISQQLAEHHKQANCDKPKLLILQGDPLEERGISAITRKVADGFGWKRGLVCLDEEIADYHSPNADRQNVILEFQYSELTAFLSSLSLEQDQEDIVAKLEESVDSEITQKNCKREAIGKPQLKDYFRHFALLQEVTKAACREICGGITVIHTSDHISEFSVTSFYSLGLELGLVKPADMVPYGLTEEMDFEALERVRYKTKDVSS